jgi:IclR family pca regulon transcriptional regulator
MQVFEGDRDFMAGFGKGLAVIECFDDRHRHLTIAQVAARTGLSRAAARRCLLTLQRLGYASFDSKFFALTPRVLRLGYAYLSATDLPQLIQPFLERLSEELQESCSATVLDGHEIVYIARSAKKRVMSVSLGVASRLPAFCTSMGRVLLAALDADEAISRLAAVERPRMTPRTRTRLDELSDILRQVRAQGYCVTDQELEIGLVSMAVPIMNSRGETVAAINVGAQSARIAADDMPARFLTSFKETQKTLRSLLKGGERGFSWT